ASLLASYFTAPPSPTESSTLSLHDALPIYNSTACVGIPMRCTETRKGRNHVNAIGVAHFFSQLLYFRRRPDDSQSVAEPLYHRPTNKYTPLQRIIYRIAYLPSDGCDQIVF